MNTVNLIGRLGKDAELSVLNNASKTNVLKFSLAVERDYKNKEGKKDVDFIPCEYIGKDFSKLVGYLTKGGLVGVVGAIQIDKYEKEGKQMTFTKVKVAKLDLLGSKKDAEASQNSGQQEGFDFEAIDDEGIPF